MIGTVRSESEWVLRVEVRRHGMDQKELTCMRSLDIR